MIDPITLLRAQEAGLPAAESHPDSPLVCFPMASEWRSMHPEPSHFLWPEPAIAARPMASDYLGKKAVKDLAHLATMHGWQYRVTYARGSWPSVGQRPSRPLDSLAVRLWRGEYRAVAVYVEASESWKWSALYLWWIGSFPNPCLTGYEAWTDAMFGPLCKPAWPGPKDWSCPSFGPLHGPKKPKAVRSR